MVPVNQSLLQLEQVTVRAYNSLECCNYNSLAYLDYKDFRAPLAVTPQIALRTPSAFYLYGVSRYVV